MPAGTTILTQTFDAVCTVISGYTGIGPTRTAKGYRNYADSENFQSLVAALTPKTQAYASFWLKSATAAQGETFPAQIIGEVVMAIAKDTSDDLNAYWDYIYNLVAAIADGANYTGAGSIKPSSIRFSLYTIDLKKTSGLVIFDFGAYGNGGIEFPDP